MPELGLCHLKLPPAIDPSEPEASRSSNDDEDVANGVWRVSLEGATTKANQQISDLLHEFVGPEEFCRLDVVGSVQQRMLHDLIQAHGVEEDLDMDVWKEAQRHAVEKILEGGSDTSELAMIPAHAMERLLSTRGYESSNGKNLGRGSFGRVFPVRRVRDGKLFAVKRQFLGDFADDMVPVLRETSILNVLKGAANIVQIEDAFLMRPAKGAAEVWSVLEHFPHNLHKVRHRFRSEETAKHVVFQVLLGLLSLHSADIVHRDCKPENVLVDLGPSPPRTVRVALCDFNTSRSVHGFAPAPEVRTPPAVPPFTRQVTDRVTTSWWRAPEMWGWADTRQMTKRDLKSLDIFALGLVWANLLAVQSVLDYWEGKDPPKYRLLEILQKVDRPADSDLNELSFSDDVSCFIRCVLAGNLEALRPELISPNWPQNQEKREDLLKVPYMGIREWVRQNAWQCKQDSPTLDLIESMTRFSYRERPTVECLVANPFFSDLRAHTPPKAWAHRAAPQFVDIREVLREEHQRQQSAAQRAEELRELCGNSAGGEGSAQDAFFQRLAANAAADVEESVRNVCARVRSTLVESHRRKPRTFRARATGCQAARHSN
jgi:serine/threonine protein kinase